jgi:aspartate aminotransferase-like enzyme/GNAT superfamily N-acetyltransferase
MLRFKVADEPAEFEAIHHLNYQTFVEEIPQHPADDSRRLVDRFHAENTYVICLDGQSLVGMIAGRCNRPFSLDGKLTDLDRYLPPHRRSVEVRLLAVRPQYRRKSVFARLAGVLAAHFRGQGCDLAVASGTIRQLGLYRHLGFRAFGPLTGHAQAQFQPMLLTLDDYAARAAPLERLAGRGATSLLPETVEPRREVRQSFLRPAFTSRSAGFTMAMNRVRDRLRGLFNVVDALVMCGSDALANDAIAAQLSTENRHGLILANGESGDCLVEHARRWNLGFDVLRADPGQAFDRRGIEAAFARARPGWVWMVACEVATGVRNDHRSVRRLCEQAGADLCIDAAGAAGLQPLDLAGARFVSAVSGRALASYPGLVILCTDGRLAPAGAVPRCLDPASHREDGANELAIPPNLLAALEAALAVDWPSRWRAIRAADRYLRDELGRHGLPIVAQDGHASPGAITVALPAMAPQRRVAKRLARSGFVLASDGELLAQRNWLQIVLAGDVDTRSVEILPAVLAAAVRRCAASVAAPPVRTDAGQSERGRHRA